MYIYIITDRPSNKYEDGQPEQWHNGQAISEMDFLPWSNSRLKITIQTLREPSYWL